MKNDEKTRLQQKIMQLQRDLTLTKNLMKKKDEQIAELKKVTAKFDNFGSAKDLMDRNEDLTKTLNELKQQMLSDSSKLQSINEEREQIENLKKEMISKNKELSSEVKRLTEQNQKLIEDADKGRSDYEENERKNKILADYVRKQKEERLKTEKELDELQKKYCNLIQENEEKLKLENKMKEEEQLRREREEKIKKEEKEKQKLEIKEYEMKIEKIKAENEQKCKELKIKMDDERTTMEQRQRMYEETMREKNREINEMNNKIKSLKMENETLVKENARLKKLSESGIMSVIKHNINENDEINKEKEQEQEKEVPKKDKEPITSEISTDKKDDKDKDEDKIKEKEKEKENSTPPENKDKQKSDDMGPVNVITDTGKPDETNIPKPPTSTISTSDNNEKPEPSSIKPPAAPKMNPQKIQANNNYNTSIIIELISTLLLKISEQQKLLLPMNESFEKIAKNLDQIYSIQSELESNIKHNPESYYDSEIIYFTDIKYNLILNSFHPSFNDYLIGSALLSNNKINETNNEVISICKKIQSLTNNMISKAIISQFEQHKSRIYKSSELYFDIIKDFITKKEDLIQIDPEIILNNFVYLNENDEGEQYIKVTYNNIRLEENECISINNNLVMIEDIVKTYEKGVMSTISANEEEGRITVIKTDEFIEKEKMENNKANASASEGNIMTNTLKYLFGFGKTTPVEQKQQPPVPQNQQGPPQPKPQEKQDVNKEQNLSNIINNAVNNSEKPESDKTEKIEKTDKHEADKAEKNDNDQSKNTISTDIDNKSQNITGEKAPNKDNNINNNQEHRHNKDRPPHYSHHDHHNRPREKPVNHHTIYPTHKFNIKESLYFYYARLLFPSQTNIYLMLESKMSIYEVKTLLNYLILYGSQITKLTIKYNLSSSYKSNDANNFDTISTFLPLIINSMKNLSKFQLTNVTLSTENISKLISSFKNSKIKSLSLQSAFTIDSLPYFVNYFMNNEYLEYLDLSFNNINVGCIILPALNYGSIIKNINISNIKLAPADMECISDFIKNNQKIESLNISNNPLSFDMCKVLANSLCNMDNALRCLYMDNCNINRKDKILSLFNKDNLMIKVLSLNNNHFKGEGLIALSDFVVSNPNLKELQCKNCALDSDSILKFLEKIINSIACAVNIHFEDNEIRGDVTTFLIKNQDFFMEKNYVFYFTERMINKKYVDKYKQVVFVKLVGGEEGKENN